MALLILAMGTLRGPDEGWVERLKPRTYVTKVDRIVG